MKPDMPWHAEQSNQLDTDTYFANNDEFNVFKDLRILLLDNRNTHTAHINISTIITRAHFVDHIAF